MTHLRASLLLLSLLFLGSLAAPLYAQPPAGECIIGPQLGATLLFPTSRSKATPPA